MGYFDKKRFTMGQVVGLLSIVFLGAAVIAYASTVTIPNTFTSGTTISSSEMNDNFSAVKSAVDDNDTRITAVESTVNNLQLTRTISIPAFALAFGSSGPITADFKGLRWSFTFSGGTYLTIKAPADYAGGDVTFNIFFQTTTSTAGIVNFFIRPTSFDSGEGEVDPGSVSCTPVSVSGTSGFGILYEQSCSISESRLTKDWWNTTMQRQGTGATYADDVIVLGVAFEYPAVQ